MRAALIVLGFCSLLHCAPVSAAQLFRNATIHPASGEALAASDLLIEGGTIKAIGTNLDSEGAEIIDASGKHLYPGLIAAGTIAGLVEIDAARPTRDFVEVGSFTPEVRSWLAVNPDSELLPVARANGITHIVPVPTGGTIAGQSAVVALHGWTIEQMAIRSPAALHLRWPTMSLDLTSRDALRDKSRFKSAEDQAKERARRIQEIDDFFSNAEAYARGRSSGAVEEVPAWEAMLPFLKGEIPLMIHADEVRQIKSAVEWAGRRNYKACIAGGRDAWMVADLLAEKKVPVLFERVFYAGSSLAGTPSRDVDPYDVHFSSPSVLHKAGVKVALGLGQGGHSASDLRNLPYHAAQAIAFGLPEETALAAITKIPAELLGVADRLGTLEPGKEATFIVATGSIFDIRTQVEQVWIAGEKTSLETRHTRLYEKYNNRPRSQ